MHTNEEPSNEMPGGQMETPAEDEGPQVVGEMPGGPMEAPIGAEEMPAGHMEAAEAEGMGAEEEMPSGQIEATEDVDEAETDGGMPSEEMEDAGY